MQIEWQPIETVICGTPKNPIRVLLWSKKANACTFGCAYQHEDGEKFFSLENYLGNWDISHWMPLPEPPKE